MKRIFIFVFSALTITLLSCKKNFLEVIDKTTILKQGYVVDLTTTQEYLNGIYLQITTKINNGISYAMTEIVADNMKPRGNGATIYNSVYTWSQAPLLGGEGQWFNGYKIIKDCNFVIEKADAFRSENEERASLLKGQALAIRAWMHFYLLNMYAQSYSYTKDASHLGIPYVLTSDKDETIKRQSVNEGYNAMISDLQQSLLLLPKSNTRNPLYFSYHAAKALIARIYLFKGDYSTAKDIATEVLADVPLMVTNYPSKLYTPDETEALFQVAPGLSSSNPNAVSFMGRYARRTIYFTAAQDIVKLYRAYPSDKRNAWIKDSTIGSLIFKFPKGPAGESDYYPTMIRSTEMALIASESYHFVNKEDSARYFINQIRQRADIPILDASITGDALLDSIRIERRKEMAFDGLRMFDLLRWKLPVIRKDALSPASSQLSYPNDKAIWPIPVEDVMYGQLTQNPSY